MEYEYYLDIVNRIDKVARMIGGRGDGRSLLEVLPPPKKYNILDVYYTKNVDEIKKLKNYQHLYTMDVLGIDRQKGWKELDFINAIIEKI